MLVEDLDPRTIDKDRWRHDYRLIGCRSSWLLSLRTEWNRAVCIVVDKRMLSTKYTTRYTSGLGSGWIEKRRRKYMYAKYSYLRTLCIVNTIWTRRYGEIRCYLLLWWWWAAVRDSLLDVSNESGDVKITLHSSPRNGKRCLIIVQLEQCKCRN